MRNNEQQRLEKWQKQAETNKLKHKQQQHKQQKNVKSTEIRFGHLFFEN